MEVYESELKKEDFFRRISERDIEAVLSVDETNTGRENASGFVIKGIWVSIFIGPSDSVWVSLRNIKKDPREADSLMKDLQLKVRQTYPLVLDKPSKEVMEIWKKKKG
jgi:hypothetical protein